MTAPGSSNQFLRLVCLMYEKKKKKTAYTVGLITYFVWWQEECLLSLEQASSESAFLNRTYLGLPKSVIFFFSFLSNSLLSELVYAFFFARKLK